MKKKIFVGIDPGKTGAIVALDEYGEVVLASLVPRIGKDVDGPGVVDLISDVEDGYADGVSIRAGIETLGLRPRQSAQSTLTTGRGYGHWEGVFDALRIPYEVVTPARWQALALEGRRKPKKNEPEAPAKKATKAQRAAHEKAVAAAKAKYRRELKAVFVKSANAHWPSLRIKQVKDYGIADAAWIAEYTRRQSVLDQGSTEEVAA